MIQAQAMGPSCLQVKLFVQFWPRSKIGANGELVQVLPLEEQEPSQPPQYRPRRALHIHRPVEVGIGMGMGMAMAMAMAIAMR